MNPDEFEKKLSEVAIWERKHIKAADGGRKPYGEPLGQVPTEIVLKKLKPKPCPVRPNQFDCVWTYKNYPYGKQKVFVQRCKTCGLTITPKGNEVDIPIIEGNFAMKILFMDEQLEKDK
jgi:hypothetical protein